MPKDECRESREVPFCPEGATWAAAAAGAVRQSVGVDVDAMGRLLPSPPKLPPFQMQQRPFAAVGTPSNLSANSAVWGSVASVRSTINGPSTSTPPSPPSPPFPPLPAVRRPLALLNDNDVAVRVLANEVRALELKTTQLTKRVKVQDQLIRGFCAQELARKEN
jgi:hypothetical protein